MEDDLYGGIEKATVAEGALDATLYEGLFTGPPSSGHHETYLQHKVHELEDLLRERRAEVQTLKSQLQDRNQKLLDATTERDILLRNISCLYNTAKEEMARKQGEIITLRAEVAAQQAKQQFSQRPQRNPRFAAPGVTGAEAAAQLTRQPLPDGTAGKRSREPEALEVGKPQAGAAYGGGGRLSSAAAEGAGAKRSRCDGGRAELPVEGGKGGAEGGAAVLEGFRARTGDASTLQPQSSLQGDAAAGGDSVAAAQGRRDGGGGGGAAPRAASSEPGPADNPRPQGPQHLRVDPDRAQPDMSSSHHNGHGSAGTRSMAGPRAGASAGGLDEHDGSQRGGPLSRAGCWERPRERDGPSDVRSWELRGAERSGGGEGRRDYDRERGRGDGGGKDRGKENGRDPGRDDGGRERGRDDGGSNRGSGREPCREVRDREHSREDGGRLDGRREGLGGRDADRERQYPRSRQTRS